MVQSLVARLQQHIGWQANAKTCVRTVSGLHSFDDLSVRYDEDGEAIVVYDFFFGAIDCDGNEYQAIEVIVGYYVNEEGYLAPDMSTDIEANRIVDKLNARKFIVADRWEKGVSPERVWDAYRTPQTYEEEKAEALAKGY